MFCLDRAVTAILTAALVGALLFSFDQLGSWFDVAVGLVVWVAVGLVVGSATGRRLARSSRRPDRPEAAEAGR